jgi:hypothetical protein
MPNLGFCVHKGNAHVMTQTCVSHVRERSTFGIENVWLLRAARNFLSSNKRILSIPPTLHLLSHEKQQMEQWGKTKSNH